MADPILAPRDAQLAWDVLYGVPDAAAAAALVTRLYVDGALLGPIAGVQGAGAQAPFTCLADGALMPLTLGTHTLELTLARTPTSDESPKSVPIDVLVVPSLPAPSNVRVILTFSAGS